MRVRMTKATTSLMLGCVALGACSSYGGPQQVGYVQPAYTASASITVGPPDLPVYEQPECPGDQYLWTPGYWAWSNGDYYWVPGTWVEAPEVGYLWTPGYWGWGGTVFVFHEGYWGPRVGFYGGINYGYGYTGQGFQGGRWDNGHYFHNQSVTNVNVTNVHNVYNTTIINNTTVVNNTVTRVSYNGGNGGVEARPTADEQSAAQERHIPPVAAQAAHVQAARSNPQLRASANQGKPPIAATPKAGAFSDPGVVPAKEAGAIHTAAAPPANNASRPNTAVHPNDLPPAEHPAAVTTGDPKDQQNQQEQEKLLAQQDQERRDLQQKQDQDHQQLAQQKADAATTQKLEEQHTQQTQQLAQKHAQQMQTLKQHQQPPHQDEPKKDKP
jgi:hypothetical protein